MPPKQTWRQAGKRTPKARPRSTRSCRTSKRCLPIGSFALQMDSPVEKSLSASSPQLRSRRTDHQGCLPAKQPGRRPQLFCIHERGNPQRAEQRQSPLPSSCRAEPLRARRSSSCTAFQNDGTRLDSGHGPERAPGRVLPAAGVRRTIPETRLAGRSQPSNRRRCPTVRQQGAVPRAGCVGRPVSTSHRQAQGSGQLLRADCTRLMKVPTRRPARALAAARPATLS